LDFHVINWDVVLRQLSWVHHVRNYHTSIHRDGADCAHQLHRCNSNCALTNAYRYCLSCKPLLLEVADLPLFRRHHAAHFVRQVNSALLSQAKCCGILCDAVDAKFFRERIKEDVAGLINRFGKIDCSVASFYPATEAPSIEGSAAVAVDMESLRNSLLPS